MMFSPMKILRTFPTLNAREVIERVKVLVKLLPEDVYDTLARHPFDPVICDILMTEDEQVHDIDMSEGREDDDKEGEELAEE